MNKITAYFKESVDELKKVKWPTKEITIQYSVTVLISVILLTTIFGLIDIGLQRLIEFFFFKG